MRGARPEAPEAAGLIEASAGALARLLGACPALRRVVLVSSTVAGRPGNVYGLSKRLDEELLRIASEGRGFDLCVLRVSSVYGPEATVERALARFLRAALAGETPVVTGSGGTGTDYVHVEDVARAVVAATAGEATGVCHVSSATETTPLEAARAALRAAGRDGEPERRPGPPWRGGGAIPNDDAFHALGWRPRYDLAEGLGSYAAWMRAVRT
jgi:UDP-glucose 4-epimerase